MTSLAISRGLEDLEQPAMSSLAVGRELGDLELWLAGLFTAAELAAAELLLQLSVAGSGADEKAAASTSTTPSSSPCWASPCSENLTVEEKQQKKEQVAEETALPLASAELDRRARKRYRRLSELYAATVLVTSASDTAEKKRKRPHDHHGLSSLRWWRRRGTADTSRAVSAMSPL